MPSSLPREAIWITRRTPPLPQRVRCTKSQFSAVLRAACSTMGIRACPSRLMGTRWPTQSLIPCPARVCSVVGWVHYFRVGNSQSCLQRSAQLPGDEGPYPADPTEATAKDEHRLEAME